METTDEMIARVSRNKAQCGCGAPAGDPCRALVSGKTMMPHPSRPDLPDRQVVDPWPELEPGSHTAGLIGPFHRYADCTDDHCPIHPD